MNPVLRVHISALGFLSDRIYTPAIIKKAELLYLLRYPHETNKDALESLKKVRTELKKNKIKLVEIECDIFSVTKVVKCVKELIEKESRNHIYLNISSGNTKSSNAFTLSSMLFKELAYTIIPYYAGYDYSKMKTDTTNIQSFPVFQIRTPDEKQCQVLKLLRESDEGLRKSQIIGHIDPKYNSTKDRKYKSKQLMKLNRQIIEKLIIDWNMVKLKGRGKGTIVILTEEGKEFSEYI